MTKIKIVKKKLITKPTKTSSNSSAIIDHIITNDSKHELQSFIVKSDLTDHYPIFCVINKNFTNNKRNFFIVIK